MPSVAEHWALHASPCNWPVHRNQSSSPPFPRHPQCNLDRPLIVGWVPGCFRRQRFGATGLGVHTALAPEAMRRSVYHLGGPSLSLFVLAQMAWIAPASGLAWSPNQSSFQGVAKFKVPCKNPVGAWPGVRAAWDSAPTCPRPSRGSTTWPEDGLVSSRQFQEEINQPLIEAAMLLFGSCAAA